MSVKPRRSESLEVGRNATGEISHVRIGRWRELISTAKRQIAEVRPLACDRIAVRIEQTHPSLPAQSWTVWQLYDLNGYLLAMLQVTDDQQRWLTTEFRPKSNEVNSSESSLFLSAFRYRKDQDAPLSLGC